MRNALNNIKELYIEQGSFSVTWKWGDTHGVWATAKDISQW